MLNLKEAKLKALAIHRIGNRVREEGYIANKELFALSDLNRPLLQDFFLKPFRNEAFFSFTHSSDLNLNEVYTFAKTTFEAIGTGALLEESVKILQHLYEVSVHPQIRGGEVYVAYFSDCMVGDMEVDALGFLKRNNAIFS